MTTTGNSNTTTTGDCGIIEITGNLFDAPIDCSLAHCVAEDMRMGRGIAYMFRIQYNNVNKLLEQRKRTGEVAVLQIENDRYVYYLVTKDKSYNRPTLSALESSLTAMRKHAEKHTVKKIAMPRIGCGLDRLMWQSVKPLIQKVFAGSEIEIIVYNLQTDRHIK